MPEWNNTPWKKIVIKARKNFYVFLIQVDPLLLSSTSREVFEALQTLFSSSTRGSSAIFGHRRLEIALAVISSPWNGPNPHCARNPGTKGGFSPASEDPPPLLLGTREFSGSNEHRILPSRPNRRYFSCRPYFVFVTRRLTDGNLKRI